MCMYTHRHTHCINGPFLVPLLAAYSLQDLGERKTYWHSKTLIEMPSFCKAKCFIITHGTNCLELNILNITQPVFSQEKISFNHFHVTKRLALHIYTKNGSGEAWKKSFRWGLNYSKLTAQWGAQILHLHRDAAVKKR